MRLAGSEYPQTQGEKHWTHLRPERVPRGERSGKAKLTEAKVLAMRRAYADGESCADIAIAVGVTRPTATRAILGHSWRHLR